MWRQQARAKGSVAANVDPTQKDDERHAGIMNERGAEIPGSFEGLRKKGSCD